MEKAKCPKCGTGTATPVRPFKWLFECQCGLITIVGKTPEVALERYYKGNKMECPNCGEKSYLIQTSPTKWWLSCQKCRMQFAVEGKTYAEAVDKFDALTKKVD
jgi:ribosomal protein S27AE